MLDLWLVCYTSRGLPAQGYTSWTVPIILTSCNVVVLHRTILYCNVDWYVKDGVVHCSRRQWLVAKWLGCGVTVRMRVRANRLGLGPENGIFFVCVKVTTVCDMMMYCKERYMENLPTSNIQLLSQQGMQWAN